MKRKFIPLVVLALTVVSGVATAVPASAVTYGDPVETPQIEFPEVVPVWVGGTSLCTGTLIAQQVVLTAAHCVYGQAGPFQISVDGSTLKGGRLIDVDATWYHPRYDAKYNQNDIGLLHLKTSANVSRLGKLPSGSLKSVGKKFLIVGWGTDQNGSITGKLHRLTLNDQATASKKFFKGTYNPKTMIGAGRYFLDENLYGGGCSGDSGGPLYMGAFGASKTVIGLTAFGARNCTTYKPTIFTRIDFYLAEINNGIQLLNSRAATAPIASGKATPTGMGPTTSTTTSIPKPAVTSPTTTIARSAYSCTASGTRNPGGGLCKIGDTGPGGGIVFYISDRTFTSLGSMCNTTCRFLESSSKSVARSWSIIDVYSEREVIGADGSAIGTGYQNSVDIINQGNNDPATSAAAYARNYSANNLTDWYLPSIDELVQIYLNKNYFNLQCGWHFSSTEYSATKATGFHNYSNKIQWYFKAENLSCAIPVRAF